MKKALLLLSSFALVPAWAQGPANVGAQRPDGQTEQRRAELRALIQAQQHQAGKQDIAARQLSAQELAELRETLRRQHPRQGQRNDGGKP